MDESQCKIRKRGSSSTSSSSLARKYRLKRAILVGKRTPILRSPVSVQAVRDGIDLLKFPTGTDGVVSARRLAATLWEINHVSSPPILTKESSRTREVMLSSDPDALPEVNGSGFDGRRRRKSAPEFKKLLVLADEEQRGGHGEALFSNGGRSSERGKIPEYKDLKKRLATAKELLNVLRHICGQHSSATESLVSALQVELDQAIVQVYQLAYDHKSYRREMRHVMQHLAEEKNKARRTVKLAGAELEDERKLRKQTERINKKLGKELADKNARLDHAVKELTTEKRTNDELEHVCQDRSEVEELKKASAEAWEEVEMLQLADVLREERVQMKLAEARYHFEEKNADIEKLRSELEAYMSKNNVVTRDDDVVRDGEESPGSANSEALRDFLQKTLGKVCQNQNIEDQEDEKGDSSSESDMHSIELEHEGGKKSFKWGYSPVALHDDSKRSSVEVFKGRKSLSEKIQWATISLLKGNAAATPTAPPPQAQKNETEDMFQKQRPSSSSGSSLKKKILSSFKMGPAKQWGQAIERF